MTLIYPQNVLCTPRYHVSCLVEKYPARGRVVVDVVMPGDKGVIKELIN